MAPTVGTACPPCPPRGPRFALGRPGGETMTPTVGTACPPCPPRGLGSQGFTLIELLVAIGVMAVMAGLGWRGIDGMLRVQERLEQRSNVVLSLQTGLAQWTTDLDALQQLPGHPALDWDGRGLRLTRRSAALAVGQDDSLQVVAWTRRNAGDTGAWLRWQSAPVRTQGELAIAWSRAALWAQNPSDDDKRREVSVVGLAQWQIFFYRGGAWSNPLSSDGTTPGAPTGAASQNPPLPDGVRLVLTLPAGEAITGTLTRDWVQPSVSGSKS
ncbi:MAG: hypothetical protein RLZZ591_1235 [Pseudomonadota bacterium]